MASSVRPSTLGAVVAGGMLGVALRAALLAPFDGSSVLGLASATLVINVIGSAGLGAVVGAIGDRRPVFRSFFGTGMLGGFTTYSAFAVQVAGMPAPAWGLALVVVSLVGGVAAAWGGLILGRALGARSAGPDDPREAE